MTSPTDSAPTIFDRSIDHDRDVVEITTVIEDAERAFNTNDADLLVEHFAQDGDAVGVTGARLSGRDEILAVSRQLFDGPLHDQRARYVVDDIRFVGADVALCRKSAWAIDAEGNDLDVGHAMVALYVLVKREARWWIVARQNTLVSP